jgi:hypothetical protein
MKKPNYKELLKQRVKAYEKQGISIEFKPHVNPVDYIGMNSEAARSMGLPIKQKCIELPTSESDKTNYHTLHHEFEEYHLMKDKGLPYGKAHNIALLHEKRIGEWDIPELTFEKQHSNEKREVDRIMKCGTGLSAKTIRRLGL